MGTERPDPPRTEDPPVIAPPCRPDATDDAVAADDVQPGPRDGVPGDDVLVGSEPLATPLVPALLVDVAGGERGSSRPTGAAEVCLVRFARLEADVSDPDLSGVGRVSASRFPRLGGVLHGRIAPATPTADLLLGGVERTIRAGYQAAVATHHVADMPVHRADADHLWDAFLPVSYRIPRSVAAAAWEVCRFDVYWVELLCQLGLEGDANRFGNGHVSPLSRSIRGLSTVGVALALAERGGRHDRLPSGRSAIRGLRRVGRGLPSAPRPLGDDPG